MKIIQTTLWSLFGFLFLFTIFVTNPFGLMIVYHFNAHHLKLEKSMSKHPKYHSVIGKRYKLIENTRLVKFKDCKNLTLDGFTLEYIKLNGKEPDSYYEKLIEIIEKNTCVEISRITRSTTVLSVLFGGENTLHAYSKFRNNKGKIVEAEISFLFSNFYLFTDDNEQFIPESEFLKEVS